MSEFWDQRFSEPGFKYGTEPNAFLKLQEPAFRRAGRVLVPGDGEGRNGVWLAQQGHRVITADSSKVGVAKAAALAAERGVTVDRHLVDLADWLPLGEFDAVVLCYVHLPPALRTTLHRRYLEALVAGGLLVVEAFHPRHLGTAPFGPKDPDLLYPLAALRSDFAAGDELAGEEVEVVLDEGPGHRGRSQVTRGVWRRR